MSNTKDKKAFEQEETANVVGDIIHLYLPFWPLFVLTISLSLFAAFMHIRYEIPIYEANATVILKNEETGTENMLKALDVEVPKKNVENEIEILKSQKLMREVVKDLGLYAQIYAPGRVNKMLAYSFTPITFVAINPDTIQPSRGMVSFTYMPSEKVVLLAGKRYPLEQPIETPYGRFRINYNSDHDVTSNSQYFLQVIKVTDVAKGMMKSLSVNAASTQSTILRLKFQDPSAKRAEDVLNDLIRVYNKAGIEDKNRVSQNTLDFIENRLDLLTIELSTIEQDKEQYMTEKGLIDVSTQGQTVFQNIQVIDQDMANVNTQLKILDEVEGYVVNSSSTSTVPSTSGLQDPQLLNLMTKLLEAELQLDRLRKTTAEQSPAIQAIRSQIAQLKPSLLENIRNFRANLQVTKNQIEMQSRKYSTILQSLPKQERELLDINRQQSIKNDIYTFLLQKREETALTYASAAPDSRLVNAAESLGFPVKPVKTSIYLFAFAIGILSSVLFVLMREKYIGQVVFRSEIEKATKATILTEILYDKSKEMPSVTDGKRSIVAEQFRTLRTALTYMGLHSDKKTILFTSSISGDGKSYVAINLGASLAIAGRKVAILELDLRKPRVSRMLELSNEPGITNYLAGMATVDQIIKPVPRVNNLYVLSAGDIPPNPTELIMNGKLDIMIEQLKRDFDYILIDTPPIGLVTDAKLLNSYADVCVYVIRHKHTPKKYLKFVNQLYQNKELNNLCIVFNGLKPRGFFGMSKASSYGYGSGYGYGYGAENDKPSKLKKKKKKKEKAAQV